MSSIFSHLKLCELNGCCPDGAFLWGCWRGSDLKRLPLPRDLQSHPTVHSDGILHSRQGMKRKVRETVSMPSLLSIHPQLQMSNRNSSLHSNGVNFFLFLLTGPIPTTIRCIYHYWSTEGRVSSGEELSEREREMHGEDRHDSIRWLNGDQWNDSV